MQCDIAATYALYMAGLARRFTMTWHVDPAQKRHACQRLHFRSMTIVRALVRQYIYGAIRNILQLLCSDSA